MIPARTAVDLMSSAFAAFSRVDYGPGDRRQGDRRQGDHRGRCRSRIIVALATIVAVSVGAGKEQEASSRPARRRG